METPELNKSIAVADNRGVFSASELTQSKGWVQTNVSYNALKHTFRGMHLQRSPHAQSKLVKVVHGSIIDIIVDLRDESYGTMYSYTMNIGDELLVPKGFAHGFITLEDHTVVQYLVDHPYKPKADLTINWNSFDGLSDCLPYNDVRIISDKDKNAPMLKDINLNL